MYHPKALARLVGLLVAWIVGVLYVVWGFLKNLSLLTIAWRVLALTLVVYGVVFYYALWIASRGVPEEEGKVSHDEPDEDR